MLFLRSTKLTAINKESPQRRHRIKVHTIELMAPIKPQEIIKASETVPGYQGNDSSLGVGAAPELLRERPR